MAQESWLIIGGAGYVGAHIGDCFLDNEKTIVIVDSFRNGLKSRIDYLSGKYKTSIPFIECDIREREKLDRVIFDLKPTGIIHTAALKSVSDSFKNQEEYVAVNVSATSHIIEAAIKYDIQKFFFSSSAAVYGSPIHLNPVDEKDSTEPISPYGLSKLQAEKIVDRFAKMEGRIGTSLRYFNVVGTAHQNMEDNSSSNLIPIVISQIKSHTKPKIFGTNYPTKDGTCVRDYIDVRDIAYAHLLAVNTDSELPRVMNVGSGIGVSVNEVLKLIYSANKLEVDAEVCERRNGDPAQLVSNSNLIHKTLGFIPKFGLQKSIEGLHH